MAEISRSALFGRLNETGFKALESAHAYCRLRENASLKALSLTAAASKRNWIAH